MVKWQQGTLLMRGLSSGGGATFIFWDWARTPIFKMEQGKLMAINEANDDNQQPGQGGGAVR